MKKHFFLCGVLVLGLIKYDSLFAQNKELSSSAKISIITCDPGQEELFTVFGHSAIRVFDPENDLDLAYNYGIFDFDQPNFYLNFAKGYLNYMLGVYPFDRFIYQYQYYNRSVYEQVLNLTDEQTHEVYKFLKKNALPENRYYYYDYFYDNCATRVWDVFDEVLGDQLVFDDDYVAPKHTFRTLVDTLTLYKPWGDFGIDICLGLPMDKKLTYREYMFLPEYIKKSFDNARIKTDQGEEALVTGTNIIFKSRQLPLDGAGIFTPTRVFWSLFILFTVITYLGFKRGRILSKIDSMLFILFGALGIFLVLLWVLTDHRAAASNLNLLWAIPFHFVAGVLLFKREKFPFLKYYFLSTSVAMILIVIVWNWIPQGYNPAFFPMVLIVGLRAFYQYYMFGKEAH